MDLILKQFIIFFQRAYNNRMYMMLLINGKTDELKHVHDGKNYMRLLCKCQRVIFPHNPNLFVMKAS